MATAVLVGIAVLGCASSPSPVPSGFVDLTTMSGVPPEGAGQNFLCAGGGFSDSVLHGSVSAVDPVWIEPIASPSGKVAVRWPGGFRARFAPTLELFDPTGVLIAREGDILTGLGGGGGSDGRFNIDELDGRTYPCF